MGERVEITRNGIPVAIIEPARPNPLSELIETGELRLAQGALPLWSQSEVTDSDAAGLAAGRKRIVTSFPVGSARG